MPRTEWRSGDMRDRVEDSIAAAPRPRGRAWRALVLLCLAPALAHPASFADAEESDAAGGERVNVGPLATRPVRPGEVPLRLEPPVVRIGLTTDARKLTLSAAGDYYTVDRATGRNLWASRHN